MPLARITSSVEFDSARRDAVLTRVSRTIAEIVGKPEAYMMVTLEQADMLMAGRPGPAAYVDLRGIGGLSGPVNKKLSKALSDALQETLGVPPDRLYITFTEVPASNWGCNGTTFG